MLVRVISDIHGNLAALKAVLDDPAGGRADSTLCLGDIVGYGSHPGDCINLVRKVCDEVVEKFDKSWDKAYEDLVVRRSTQEEGHGIVPMHEEEIPELKIKLGS